MPSVSLARSGSTSIETRPSSLVRSATGLKRSQAFRTSSMIRYSNTTRSTGSPLSTSWRTCSSYLSPSAMALAKIVGLVVTPTTDFSLMSSSRFPVSMRSRDRSSSQIETPASDRDFKRSFIFGLPDAVVRGGHDGLRGDAELLVDAGEVRRGAVVLDRDDPAVVADDLAPALGDAGLDGDPRLDGQGDDGLAVRRVLLVEPLAARHRHHAGPPLLGEAGSRLDGELHLRAGADQHHVGEAAVGVQQDMPAAVDVGRVGEPLLAAREDRHVLAGQGEAGGPSGPLEHGLPDGRHLVGVGRADDVEARDRAHQRSAGLSIGWWVGPSSPRPIESWVQT